MHTIHAFNLTVFVFIHNMSNSATNQLYRLIDKRDDTPITLEILIRFYTIIDVVTSIYSSVYR